jgi:alpha-tubulin suppressor-like RCC1 family protein
MVATGGWHTCALRKDGKLFCWGGNDNAEVGVPAGGNVLRPVEVPNSLSIRKLTLGLGSSCALTSDDRVACWGDDQFGQLGDGAAGGSRPTPAFVKKTDGTDLRFVADLAAGAVSACALVSSGVAGVYCWGHNEWSQLGRAAAQIAQSPAALLVPSSSSARLLAVGETTVHFVDVDDKVCGWGANRGSAISNGALLSSDTPTCFSLPSVLQTVLGGANGCGRLSSGAVQCWGLVIGSNGTIAPPPGMVLPGIAATTLGGGFDYLCARDANGTARCWGVNSDGALGDGTSQHSTVPTTVLNALGDPLTGVLSDGISSGGSARHTCAILGDGSLHCWGLNDRGQIGNGATTMAERRAVPVRW